MREEILSTAIKKLPLYEVQCSIDQALKATRTNPKLLVEKKKTLVYLSATKLEFLTLMSMRKKNVRKYTYVYTVYIFCYIWLHYTPTQTTISQDADDTLLYISIKTVIPDIFLNRFQTRWTTTSSDPTSTNPKSSSLAQISSSLLPGPLSTDGPTVTPCPSVRKLLFLHDFLLAVELNY